MFEADDKTRNRVEAFRNTGTGISPTTMCWGCKLPKSQIGGSYFGRIRLFHCAMCKPIKEASIAAAKAARAERTA